MNKVTISNENELKVDIEMILYDLNTVKLAGETGSNPDSFLAKSANNAINLIEQQQQQLEDTKNALDFMTDCHKEWSERAVQLQEQLEAAQKDLDELRIDRAMKWIPEVKRIEDMSAKGYLKIMRDGDGDVIVVVCAADGDKLKASESVEFCTGRGGNRSPNTVNALIHLAAAMEKDNQERPIHASPKPEENDCE